MPVLLERAHPDLLTFADDPRLGFHPAGELDSVSIIGDETDLFDLWRTRLPEGLDCTFNAHLVGLHVRDVLDRADGAGGRLECVHRVEHCFGDVLPLGDPLCECPRNGRPTMTGARPLCHPVCFLVHLRQLHPGEAFARIRPLGGAFRPLALPPFGDDLAGPLRPALLGAEFRLGADVVQFGFPGANLLFLREGQVREVLDDAVWVVGIHLRLRFLLDRRPELRLVVDDLEAVLVDAGVFGSFECLFIHRNDLATRVVTRHWSLGAPKALTRRHRDVLASRFSDDNDRQNHLRALARAFASALPGASESAPACGGPNQHRAPSCRA